ncbi:MAG: AMP-binding protein, partial [Chitinophagaceae bacterium]|nr:AMP-binding protein [Anaerolineae bacterium]
MYTLPIRLDARPATLIEQALTLHHDHADQIALVMIDSNGETSITYGQLFDRAAEYAHALSEARIRPGDLVVLILQHGEAVIYGFWGALLMGAVPSIFPFLTDKLDPARYFDSVRQLIDHSGVKAVITTSDLEADLRACLVGVDVEILNAEHLSVGEVRKGESATRPYKAAPESTAFLQHSSGSTGLQKGVMLSHRAVLNQVASISAAIRLTPEDIVVSWLPLYHDMGLIAGFIMPILQGIKLVLMSP